MSRDLLVSGVGLLTLTFIALPSLAADQFEQPVRIEADGQIIDTGESWGHSGPCVHDVDGDGLEDLVVGDVGGKFRLYRNIGEPGRPAYKDAGNLKAGDGDASVNIYCCIGSQPRFVDLNGDGRMDFISNSYDPGHCYFFQGLGEGRFAAGEELLDKAGVPVRSTPMQQREVQSFGSFFAPVDWDADGDIDILIGCFDGGLKLRINEGDAQSCAFAPENQVVHAAGEPLKVKEHCCPTVADWDGDGLWDVIAGSDDGSVTWFRNVGAKSAPELAAGVTLVAPPDGIGYDLLLWSDDEIEPAIRTQVDVVDYNGDGRLDLLVGDFCTRYEPRSTLTEAERREIVSVVAEIDAVNKSVREKLEALREEFKDRYPGGEIHSEEATNEWSKAFQELRDSPETKEREIREVELAKQMRKYLADTHRPDDSLFSLAKPHGYVWLFIRK